MLNVFLTGPVYHENCDCPQEESSAWLEEMNCPQVFPQIQRDLANFPVVDPDKIAVEIPQRFGQRQSLCHYTIKDNEVQYGFKKHLLLPSLSLELNSLQFVYKLLISVLLCEMLFVHVTTEAQ